MNTKQNFISKNERKNKACVFLNVTLRIELYREISRTLREAYIFEYMRL